MKIQFYDDGRRHLITDFPVTMTEAKGRLCDRIPQLACTPPTVVPDVLCNPEGISPGETW